jgi:DNA-directed RNA polymerase omega subunit
MFVKLDLEAVMSVQAMDDLLPKSGFSVYRLIRMAANRALELSDGKPTLIKNPASDKVTSIALQEIAQGKVETKEAVEMRQSQTKKGKK